MKCPECLNNSKYKYYGMTCSYCRRPFALNPKEKPYFSDMAVHKSIEQVSGAGHYYFTYNQLFAQIFRLRRRKAREAYFLFFLSLCSLLCLSTVFYISNNSKFIYFPLVFFVLFGVCFVIDIIRHHKYKNSIVEIISTYHNVHPIEKMVDGKRFESTLSRKPDDETKEYAPERILIVEHNDLADMLIMNRFHLENKTLVVSADKYPANIFDACQTFLHNHPDIPVCLIHDASIKGNRMHKKLLADSTWNLNTANVKDIGLFPQDTDRLKTPMWLPPDSKGNKILLTKKSDEHIRNGYRMPVDVAQPKPLMGAMGLAAVSGMALLSSELLAELRQDATMTGVMGGWGGGFG